jgi:hypothetical protein
MQNMQIWGIHRQVEEGGSERVTEKTWETVMRRVLEAHIDSPSSNGLLDRTAPIQYSVS